MCAALDDPYRTLGLRRDASDDDIKKAFRKKALETHPDKVLAKNPDLDPEVAQNAFAKVGNAFEVLKDPEKRREYDLTGQYGGGGGGGHPSHAEQQRMMREWIAMMQQQQQQPPKPFPQPEMEARIRTDVATIHRASRASGISTEKDERRAAHAGKEATIAKTDPSDGTVKLRVMVSLGRAEELWYGGSAIWDPRVLAEDLEVQVCPDVEAVHLASRAAGIDVDNDVRRAACCGKLGTVIKVDHADGTAKVQVSVKPGRADQLWFGIAALEPRAK